MIEASEDSDDEYDSQDDAHYEEDADAGAGYVDE